MHEHTKDCEDGCVWLAMHNQMMAALMANRQEGKKNDGPSHA